MRLIDADDLIEVFIAFALMRSGQYRESFTNADGVRSIEIDCAEDIINRQKTIDAEPVKHARWIDQQQHDPALKNSIGGDDLFLQKPVKTGKLPWWDYNANNPGWDDSNDAGLRYYLEKCYHVVAKGKVDDAIAFVHGQNSFHPVRDYLAGLK